MNSTLVAALRSAESAARTIVISFDPSALAAIRRIDPSIMIGLLVEEANPDSVKTALDVGARQLCPRSSVVTSELVKQAHRADLHLATWTVNLPEEMRSVTDLGVDGIMTDFPDRLRAVTEDLREATRELPPGLP